MTEESLQQWARDADFEQVFDEFDFDDSETDATELVMAGVRYEDKGTASDLH